MLQLIWLVPLLPLLASAVNLLAGKRLGKNSAYLACAAVASSFVLAVLAFFELVQRAPEDRTVVLHLFDWIHAGGLDIPASLRLDQLSMTMILLITGVGTLIHVYSIGYMHGDPRYSRFFAYMNLFVFFMLTLVLGDNFLILYVGWEGVGLCSYLLIGFWFEKPSASQAAKKAFITTRVGDTLMLIGIALIVVHFGTLNFGDVLSANAVAALPTGVATAIALLLFAGAAGKSAQFPLHVWLPDAMEGPTPVSALIHAATMVTAGVYLVVRTHVLFTPAALTVVLIIGLFTAFYAATAACAQDDLKRVLAYSTISQLGYMFFAAGLGAFGLAMGLLVLHAFYKGLMFLASGSVMHGTNGELDMKRMGGLLKFMPFTGWFFIVGALSLSGVPPFDGFFGKDPIIGFAAETGHGTAWVFALVTAFLSAFYIARLISLTFFGNYRGEEHPHESPKVMLIPLGVLAVLAVGGGVLELNTHGALLTFLAPVVGELAEPANPALGEPWLALISVIVAVAGIATAWWNFAGNRSAWRDRRAARPELHSFLQHAWFIDWAYANSIGPIGTAMTEGAAAVDEYVVDGTVRGLGRLTTGAASAVRKVQTGYVRSYAIGIVLGSAVLLFWLAVSR